MKLLYHIRHIISSPYGVSVDERIRHLIDSQESYSIKVKYNGGLLRSTPEHTEYGQRFSPPIYIPHGGLIHYFDLLCMQDIDVELIYKDMYSYMSYPQYKRRYIDVNLTDVNSSIESAIQDLYQGKLAYSRINNKYRFIKHNKEIPSHWLSSIDQSWASLEWLVKKGLLLKEGCLFIELNLHTPIEKLVHLISINNQIFIQTNNPNLVADLVTQISHDHIRIIHEDDISILTDPDLFSLNKMPVLTF